MKELTEKIYIPTNLSSYRCLTRVAKFACPRVLDDQKMSEDNQELRSDCPPAYQILWGKYFENNCPYKFFKDFILTLSFSNKHISFWELKTNCISYEGNQIYVKDNQISNFCCPPTTNFGFEFCYPKTANNSMRTSNTYIK